MIFGDLVGLKLPDICLTGEKNPGKISPRKLVPTGDRTRARCVTDAHATACSTAVDLLCIQHHKIERIHTFNSIDIAYYFPRYSFFKLISICKFQNIPRAFGFEVKHSKFFCINFRTRVIILSMDFMINKLFWPQYFFFQIKQISFKICLIKKNYSQNGLLM